MSSMATAFMRRTLRATRARYHTTLSWGSSSEGKLGLGDIFESRSAPTAIPDLKGKAVTNLSAGVNHSAVVVAESDPTDSNKDAMMGTVRAWGSNFYGQVGYLPEYQGSLFKNDDDVLGDPKHISENMEDECVVQIACGDYHNVVLTQSGKVITWGAGLLGHGNEQFESRPFAIKLFENSGVRVRRIGARHGISFALASKADLQNNNADVDLPIDQIHVTDVFLWGNYTLDASGRRVKSLSPTRVPTEAHLDTIHLAAVSQTNMVIQGIRDGRTTYLVFGACHKNLNPTLAAKQREYRSFPYFPMLESVDTVTDAAPLELVATLHDNPGQSAPREIHLVDNILVIVRENDTVDIKHLSGSDSEPSTIMVSEPIQTMAITPQRACALARNGSIYEWRLDTNQIGSDFLPPPLSLWGWMVETAALMLKRIAPSISKSQSSTQPDHHASNTETSTTQDARIPNTMAKMLMHVEPTLCGTVPGATKVAAGWDHFLVYTPLDLSVAEAIAKHPVSS